VSGSNGTYPRGVYGTRGVASASNAPGGRRRATGWADSSGAFWVYGGYGVDAAGAQAPLSDLWRFDGSQWTWMSGSSLRNGSGYYGGGVYGTQGVSAAGNVPGVRESPVGWVDGSGTFWIFGGFGKDSASSTGWLNDLWTYQP
jgi:N-acetylneuraminic acid mutarotase